MLANKQELLKENKRAKNRRIGAHLLSSIFYIIVWEGVPYFIDQKEDCFEKWSPNDQTRRRYVRPTELTEDFFILENTIFQGEIQKLKTVFFFGDHLFLHRLCPLKMVISKNRSDVRTVILRSAGVERECRRKYIIFGRFGLRLSPLSSEH